MYKKIRKEGETVFRICLIGCGYMTEYGHGPACKLYAETHPATELAACCDINLSAAERVCAEFGFRRAYTDYTSMVEAEKPDVVLVITPVQLTAQVSMDLLQRGISVILEKPPGMDVEENQRIHEAAVNCGGNARVAFNRRYMPLVRALRQELEEKHLSVLDIDCMFLRCNRTDADFSTTAIHGIDTVSHLAGSDYASCRFTYSDMERRGTVVTNFHMSAQMENGANATLHFLPCAGCAMERLTVTADGYTFFLELPVPGALEAKGKLVCAQNGEVYKTILGDKDTMFESNGFYDESRLFFDALRSGEQLGSDVASGRSAVAIARCLRNREVAYE